MNDLIFVEPWRSRALVELLLAPHALTAGPRWQETHDNHLSSPFIDRPTSRTDGDTVIHKVIAVPHNLICIDLIFPDAVNLLLELTNLRPFLFEADGKHCNRLHCIENLFVLWNLVKGPKNRSGGYKVTNLAHEQKGYCKSLFAFQQLVRVVVDVANPFADLEGFRFVGGEWSKQVDGKLFGMFAAKPWPTRSAARKWIQHPSIYRKHFDICAAKRKPSVRERYRLHAATMT